MGRLTIYNSFKINGSVFIDGEEYGITTPDIQSEQTYIWEIHKVPKGEPPYKIGEIWLYKEIEILKGGKLNKIVLMDGMYKTKHTKWVSTELLKTIEPIINTIRGSIRLGDI
jgi:hypothetical protein